MPECARARAADPGAAAAEAGKTYAAETSPSPRPAQVDLALAQPINTAHEQAQHATRTALAHAIACGRLLAEAKAKVGHGGWLPWVEANLSFGDRQARKYIRLAAHADEIGIENADLTIDDAQALLASRNESHSMRVMSSSASAEWYTPAHIVARAREMLGEIDLDPCWHSNSQVEAHTTYGAADDGLRQPWAGRVWLNPPYGREIAPWIERLAAQYASGAVTEALTLLPARVDTEWFRRLDPYPRCFVFGRLTFANAGTPAPFPSAVIYLGERVARFAEVFGQIGGIFVRFALRAAP